MDMSRVSACTFPLRERPWQDALQVIARSGFDKVDLLGRLPHLSLDPAEYDPDLTKEAAERLGLHIANLGTYVGRGFASEDEAERERELAQLRRAVDVAVLFGSRSIRVMPGDDDPARIARIAPWFAKGAQYAAERGVYLGFETHGGAISGDPARCRELCDAVASPHFGVLYDPCNVMGAGVDYRLALWTMREHIVHVHVKDAAVTMDAGFRRVMLGDGQIDYAWVLDALDAIGYDGHLALEYELPSPPPEEGLPVWYERARRL